MKAIRMLAATALGFCLTAAAAPQPRFNAPADVDAITAIEKILATEIDMKKLIDHYADDAMVLDIYAPGIFKGRDQIYAGFAPQMAKIKTLKHSIPEMTVATNGNFACAAMRIAFETTFQDGSQFKVNVRQLDAYKKIDGRWKIAQQHVALPLDPKTLQAINAEPIQPRLLTWSKTPLEAPSTTAEQGKKEIREFMDIGGESLGLDMLMSYYGPGDDILLYDSLHPQALIGQQEIRGYYTELMNSYKGIKLSMPHFAADSDGSFGIQMDTQDVTLTMNDGSKRNVALRQSDCMRRVGGKWYSFLEMISYPVDMSTNRGIMEGPGAQR